MKRIIGTGLVAVLIAGLLIATTDAYAGKGPKGPKPSNCTNPPSADPQGSCDDIYYESCKKLSDGTEVTWTSSFGGFDYTAGDDYTVTVSWSVDQGSATFQSFDGKKKTWTPKRVDGTWGYSGGSLTVNMDPMHRSVEPDWEGYIGNGHFKLTLIVNGIKAKLGVNVHLEDPDDGQSSRCP